MKQYSERTEQYKNTIDVNKYIRYVYNVNKFWPSGPPFTSLGMDEASMTKIRGQGRFE